MSTNLNHTPAQRSPVIVDFGWTYGTGHGRLPEYDYSIGADRYPPGHTVLQAETTLPSATIPTTFGSLEELESNFITRGTIILDLNGIAHAAVAYTGLAQLAPDLYGFTGCTGGTGTFPVNTTAIYDTRYYTDSTIMGQTVEFDTQDQYDLGLPQVVVPPGIRILSYHWDFGNGEIGYGPHASTIYTYAIPPTSIQCTLTVTDSLNRTFSAAKRLNLQEFELMWGTDTKVGSVTVTAPSMIVGVNDAEGWGPVPAATIYDAGIRWARLAPPSLDSGQPDVALAEGFNVLMVLANIADATNLTDLDIATQAALAVSQATAYPGVSMFEFMNEPWLKGSGPHPVKYGRMYMAALAALRSSGFTQPLLFMATGSFQQPATSLTGTLNGTSTVTLSGGVTTDELVHDMDITPVGGKIDTGTWIGSIDSTTQFTLNKSAIGSGSQLLNFAARWSPIADRVTDGWVARACQTVAGLHDAILENGISFHPYGMPTEINDEYTGGVGVVAYFTTRLATQLSVSTTDLKFWITEYGYFIDGGASGRTIGVGVADEAEQALRTDEALAAMRANSAVKATFYYQTHDTGWGLMNSPPSDPNSTRESFAVVARYATGR